LYRLAAPRNFRRSYFVLNVNHLRFRRRRLDDNFLWFRNRSLNMNNCRFRLWGFCGFLFVRRRFNLN
jgi:hypothetical protein